MKQISKYILVLTALLVSTVSVIAQTDKTYNNDGGVSTYKQVDGPNSDGSYTITLETFATGTTTVTTSSTPVDIVLVLDFSKSMVDNNYTNKDGETKTRLAALADAVNAFVDEIAQNDGYDDNGQRRKDQDGNVTTLGNRLAIITYTSSIKTPVSYQDVFANKESIKSAFATAVNQRSGSGTRTDLGVDAAKTMLTNTIVPYRTGRNEESNKVVVLFTDGAPTTDQKFNTSYANTAISKAKDIKTATSYEAVVYTVGLVESDDSDYSDCITFMKYVSSNYPNATSMTNAGEGGTDEGEYFQDATKADLSDIFKSISEASGGSSEEIGSSTQVRDIVSSSFVIPEGTTANDITIKTQKIKSDGTGWLAEQDVEGVTPVISTNTAGNSTLTVQGFDYSKDDTVEGDGTGNWVGIRKPDPKDSSQDFWAGQKLIIRFNVKVNEGTTAEQGTTGGITQTNTPESGVYVYNETTEEYECVNNYTVPATVLPINIIIKKSGLRSGESASFEIWKIAAKTDEEGNIVYNAIGKPQPGEKEYTPKESDTQDDILKGKGWDKWSKVVVTNKTATNGATITKTLLSLDPNWVYMVTEDDWGWAYETTGAAEMQSTSTMIINPYTFTNKEKTGVIKHAEAVSINHFATSANGTATEEHYKSSKVKSF